MINKGDIKAFLVRWPQLTLKKELKVKVRNWKRFPGHDFLLVVFTFQTPSSNDKGGIRPF